MDIFVSDIMTLYPVIVKPDITLQDAAKKMIKERVGSLLIVNKKRLVGFISEKDIVWALIKKSKEDLSKILAIDISPRKIATIRPNATLDEAIAKMKRTKFQRLPVIQNGELVGMITIKDILTFYPGLYHELDEFAKIKEESAKLERIKKAQARKIEGMCEECGNFDTLHSVDGVKICSSCADLKS